MNCAQRRRFKQTRILFARETSVSTKVYKYLPPRSLYLTELAFFLMVTPVMSLRFTNSVNSAAVAIFFG